MNNNIKNIKGLNNMSVYKRKEQVKDLGTVNNRKFKG